MNTTSNRMVVVGLILGGLSIACLSVRVAQGQWGPCELQTNEGDCHCKWNSYGSMECHHALTEDDDEICQNQNQDVCTPNVESCDGMSYTLYTPNHDCTGESSTVMAECMFDRNYCN